MLRTISPSLELDDACWERFAALGRAMLRGELPKDPPPDIRIEDYKGLTEEAIDLFERYRDRGPAGAARSLAPHLTDNPRLARALTESPAPPLPAPGPGVKPARKLRSYTPDEILARPPILFLDAERTIQERGTTMLVAQPGTGKSLWALRKLHEVSAKHPVLLIAAEAQGGLGDRIRALQIVTGKKLPAQCHIIDHPVSLRDEDEMTMLLEHARELRARVICFDTWAACTAGADENAARDVSEIFGLVERLKSELGCAVLLVHHTRKDGGIYRGSSAILGSLDNLFVLTEDDGEITLKADKTRDSSKPKPLHYRILEVETRYLEDGSDTIKAPAIVPAHELAELLGEDEAAKVTGNQRKILEALDAFAEGLTFVALQDASGLSGGTYFRALKRLSQAGYINKGEGGAKAPYVITDAGKAAM